MRDDIHLDIRGSGQGWAVFRGEERLSPWQSSQINAVMRANTLEARLRQRTRPCLCCGTSFQSTGPHHRLCDTCRQTDFGVLA